MTYHLAEARRLCVEIGLQTYGRKPSEMLATSDGDKLRRAEAIVRDICGLIKSAEQKLRDDAA